MTWGEAKEVAKHLEPDFLPRARSIGGHTSYVCPCCSNGSGRSGTGITKKSQSSTQYHCFKCGESMDVFELYRRAFGVSNAEAFAGVFSHFGLAVDGKSGGDVYERRTAEIADAPQEPEEEPVDCSDYFRACARENDPSYLERRGISAGVQKHYMVGTDRGWKNPKVVARFSLEGKDTSLLRATPRCIIPTSRCSYLARDTRTGLSEKESQYAKQKFGKSHLFNEKFSLQKQKEGAPLFVTEGEIDAMSICEASDGAYEAIGLGSVSNWRKIPPLLESWEGVSVVLALDNDEAGERTSSLLREALEGRGASCSVLLYEGKDPNEALSLSKESLAESLRIAAFEAKTKAVPEKERGEERLD